MKTTPATLLTAALSLSVISASPADAQTARVYPDTHAAKQYEPFLRILARAQRKADELNQSMSGKGNALRNAVCERLSLAQADCSFLLDLASTTETRLRELDGQAHDLIDSIRKKYPHTAHYNGALLPDPPPELAVLQAQRDALVGATLAEMKQRLTPDEITSVRIYLDIPAASLITPAEKRASRTAPGGEGILQTAH